MSDANPSPAPLTCTACGTRFAAAEAPGEHCPRCMMQMALDPDSSRPGGMPAPDPEELASHFPGYEIEGLIGRGGMASVYKARQDRLDRYVAIKVMTLGDTDNPELSARFSQEARLLAGLDHPGIVRIHDFGEAGELFYLVMEYVDGASLRDLMRQGKLSASEAMSFVPQLCDALQYAHDQGVVHRDVKPENILVDTEGRVRLADFGLAKRCGAELGLGLTASGQALGTPHYMAPEQLYGAGVDHRADIYSLGVVVYEMLTGELPVGRFGPPSQKSKGGKVFDAPVMRSLATEPADRYQHARDVKRDLSQPLGRVRLRKARDRRPETNDPTGPSLNIAISVATGIFVAAFLTWVSFVHPNLGPEGMTMRESFSAWKGHVDVFGQQIDCWLISLLGVFYAGASAMRRHDPRSWRRVPLVLSMTGLAFCLFCVISVWVADQVRNPINGSMMRMEAGMGLWLTLIGFAFLSFAELPAQAQRRGSRRNLARQRRGREARRERQAPRLDAVEVPEADSKAAAAEPSELPPREPDPAAAESPEPTPPADPRPILERLRIPLLGFLVLVVASFMDWVVSNTFHRALAPQPRYEGPANLWEAWIQIRGLLLPLGLVALPGVAYLIVCALREAGRIDRPLLPMLLPMLGSIPLLMFLVSAAMVPEVEVGVGAYLAGAAFAGWIIYEWRPDPDQVGDAVEPEDCQESSG